MFTDEHVRKHIKLTNKVKFSCNECGKLYGDMRKLRRHDWRCHRSIECTICSEKLESRQDITSHRRVKHRMFRKIFCKYFPACYDEDECLFEHNFSSEEENISSVCPSGLNCSDQACSYSEQNHRSVTKTLCRYQERCNRSGCQFKHGCARKAFLGEGPSEIKRT